MPLIIHLISIELLRKMTRSCSISHTGPIHVTVFSGGHTYTHIYTHCGKKQFQEASHVLAFSQHVLGLKYISSHSSIF